MEYESKQNRLDGLPEWQRQIIQRHPLLYLEPSLKTREHYEQAGMEIPEDFCSLRFGFECDQGWAALLEELSATGSALIKVLRAFGFQHDACIQAFIVKEKMGVLSWAGHDNLLEPFRSLWFGYKVWIKERSSDTCEKSGKFGQLRNFDGWIMTLCDEEHQKELMRRRKSRRKSGKANQ
jgi:hypothetical protein